MDIITNPLFLMSIAIISGLMIGSVQLGRFKLGVSGILFSGMFISQFVYMHLSNISVVAYGPTGKLPEYAARIVNSGIVEKEYFNFFLLLFVASVGLHASQDAARLFYGNGLKFIILTMVTTFSGALTAFTLVKLLPGVDRLAVGGVFTGALTSSPGLAVALEAVSRTFLDPTSAAARTAQGSVGLGYAIAYPFSVVTVILAMQLLPQLFKINVQEEVKLIRTNKDANTAANIDTKAGIELAGFAFVCAVGMLVGRIALPLGSFGSIRLETTGGVLITALILGNLNNLGPIHFRIKDEMLLVIKDIALAFFLAYVGLNYGHQAVNALLGPNVLLVVAAIASTLMAILIGFIFGRYILKLNWVLLAGGLCGSMTSTPGLGAAIDATGSNEAAGGYGSTYPFGLLCKVLLVLAMYKIV